MIDQQTSRPATVKNNTDCILTSVLPRILVRYFDANPAPLTEARLHRFSGAAIFADISGFTALTESLAKRGSAGIEELTTVLNQHFGSLIDTIYAHGGDIFKFAGDALLAFWPAEDGDLARVAEQAACCALAAQQAFQKTSGEGGFSLRIRIGGGVGPITMMITGGVKRRWQMVATGAALGQIGPILHDAQPGEVVLSKEMCDILGSSVTGRFLENGASVLQAFCAPRPVPFPPTAALETSLSEATSANLRRLVSTTFVSNLEQGDAEWINELRRVTVIFIHFPGLTNDTPIERAQSVTLILQEILSRYNGALNKLSVDDKGAAVVAVFGLPNRSHEDDAARGVLAAVGIQEQLRSLNVVHSIGVTTGMAFCGVIGNTIRREYTVIGDVVNLSARLMQKAQGGILCDEVTREGATGRAEFEQLPALSIKGKAEPIPVFRPSPLTGSAKADTELPIAGRLSERESLAGCLKALWQGQGSTAIIEGPAGIGKTRLAADLIDEARRAGFPILKGSATEMDAGKPYFALGGIFRDLFATGSSEANSLTREHVSALITTYAGAEWTDRIPLINAVLPLHFPDTAVTAKLEGPAWSAETHELLLRLLSNLPVTALAHSAAEEDSKGAAGAAHTVQSGAAPKVLIFEDAHWLDSASWAFLKLAAKKLTSTLLVITTRPMGSDAPEEYRAILSGEQTNLLQLNPMDRPTILRIVCQRLGVTSLPDRLAAGILEKAEGSPLFAIELALSLRDSGAITITNGECEIPLDGANQEEFNLPGTLQAAITSRIDRLERASRIAVKVASAIGPAFGATLLRHIYPLVTEKDNLGNILFGLSRQEIILASAAETDGWSFRSAVFQGVAYSLMVSGQRRQLHRHIAEWLESGSAESSSRHDLLAWHWGNLVDNGETDPEVISKAADYCIRAGEQAARRWANREAVALLQNAVKFLQMLPASAERDRKELSVQCSMGGPLIATKGFAAPDTEHAFSRAWELCRQLGQSPQEFNVLSGLWNFFVGAANMKRAKALSQELVTIAALSEDPGYAIRAHRAAGETAYWTANLHVAREHLEQAVALYRPEYHKQEALATGQDPAVVSMGFLSWSLWQLGLPGKALRTGQEAVALAYRLEHRHSIAMATISQALLLSLRREYKASREMLEPLIALARDEGFQLWSAGAMIFYGWITAREGDASNCIKRIREYVCQWSSGAQIFLPYYLSLLADTYRKVGQPDKGITVIETALEKSTSTGEIWWLPELFRLKGSLLLADSAANQEMAEACFREAIRVARNQNAKALELRAAVRLGRILIKTDRRPECVEMISDLVSKIEDGDDTLDVVDAKALAGANRTASEWLGLSAGPVSTSVAGLF